MNFIFSLIQAMNYFNRLPNVEPFLHSLGKFYCGHTVSPFEYTAVFNLLFLCFGFFHLECSPKKSSQAQSGIQLNIGSAEHSDSQDYLKSHLVLSPPKSREWSPACQEDGVRCSSPWKQCSQPARSSSFSPLEEMAQGRRSKTPTGRGQAWSWLQGLVPRSCQDLPEEVQIVAPKAPALRGARSYGIHMRYF